ncbi:hypothetical protein DL98DRAFT_659182 [Cadophora sp. DSE1049]|nr:hypothetical protein DL98DRAFT_659182 [Cadophora sp. DSE1049]
MSWYYRTEIGNTWLTILYSFGNAVGAFAGGYLTDVYSRRHARSHHGVFVPESRLHLLIVPVICVPAGLLMFGFGAQKLHHWSIMFVGFGLINVGLTGVSNIGMTYVMDSYYPVAAEALLVVNGLKNVVAFGFTYGAVPWVVARGYQEVFGIMTGIFLAILALAVPMTIFGARIRQYTSRKFKLIF